ncbi:MAG: IPT/TIG domain-containing protein [Bacteroidetes bacterium]|nr:IPT/TIG domain-containing protein [Bacteroidota bacterium]
MIYRFLPFLLCVAVLLFVSCSDDDDGGSTVTPNYTITIKNVVPISGPIGSLVKITGSNFGTEPAELSITFGSIPVTPISLADDEIVLRVPAELEIGVTAISLQRMTGKQVTIQYTVQDPIVGKWVSEGMDVAQLLSGQEPFIRKVTATFRPDGSYLAVYTDSSDVSRTYTGSYFASDGGAPAPNDRIRQLELVQYASNDTLTFEGIYEVAVNDSNITMKLEIVQTDPAMPPMTPPTPAGGFGSTSGGTIGETNLQRYVKQ